jgi:prepilin peptidase CpaA
VEVYLLVITILLLLLFVAAWQDFNSYHISNLLVIPGAALGVLLNAIPPEGLGIFESLLGWIVGLLLLMPFYLLRVMAAGDVKLMAMVGAFLGSQAMIDVLLYVFLAGGVLALSVAWYRGALKRLFYNTLIMLSSVAPRRFQLDPSLNVGAIIDTNKLPYGVAIAAGTAIFLATRTY